MAHAEHAYHQKPSQDLSVKGKKLGFACRGRDLGKARSLMETVLSPMSGESSECEGSAGDAVTTGPAVS